MANPMAEAFVAARGSSPKPVEAEQLEAALEAQLRAARSA
jgi:hypothetical protein